MNTNNNKIVIDFSAFVCSVTKDVIIKELSIVEVESKCAQSWIFKPPQEKYTTWPRGTDFRHNSWLSDHYHGIDFTTGFTSYEFLETALNFHCSEAQMLLVSDEEKARVLERIFQGRRVVFSLEHLGCPSLPKEPLFPQQQLVECYDEGSTCRIYGSEAVGPSNQEANEQREEEKKKDVKKCLYHHWYAPGFVCTSQNAHRLADWCAANLELLDLNLSAVRERTFRGWELTSPSAEELADAGFVRLTSTRDCAKCVYCGLVLYQWLHGDDPLADHDFNSPYCKFLRYRWQEEGAEEETRNLGSRRKHNSCKGDCCSLLAQCNDELSKRYANFSKITKDELFAMCKA